MAGLTDAAANGSKRDVLECLRDELARAIENSESGRDIAALSKRLVDVLNELSDLPEPKPESPLEKARAGNAR